MLLPFDNMTDSKNILQVTRLRKESLPGLIWHCYTVSHFDWLSDRVDNLVSSLSVTGHPPHVARSSSGRKRRKEKQRSREGSASSQNTNICRVYFTDRKASKTWQGDDRSDQRLRPPKSSRRWLSDLGIISKILWPVYPIWSTEWGELKSRKSFVLKGDGLGKCQGLIPE